MAYTIIVAANASDPARCKFMLLSQVLQLENILEIQVVRLFVYDDLSKQAVAYREVSLLLKTTGT
jgi:F-type H+-transporting ATPase subunit alpha